MDLSFVYSNYAERRVILYDSSICSERSERNYRYESVATTMIKYRPITKKSAQSEFSAEDEKAIFKVAEQLADLQIAMEEQYLELESIYEVRTRKNSVETDLDTDPSPFQSPVKKYFSDDGLKAPYEETSRTLFPATAKDARATFSPVNKRRQKGKKKRTKETCEFCFNNDNPDWVNHRCKNEYGEVECPYLSGMTCPVCSATGKKAHTKRHCPRAQEIKMKQLEIAVCTGVPK